MKEVFLKHICVSRGKVELVEGMENLENRICNDSNGLDYVLVGDYYIPVLALPEEIILHELIYC